jgi:hypothetical protein
MVPIYGILARERSGWDDEREACELTAFGRLGCGWSDIDAPVDLGKLWYDHPPMGPGGPKVFAATVIGGTRRAE